MDSPISDKRNHMIQAPRRQKYQPMTTLLKSQNNSVLVPTGTEISYFSCIEVCKAVNSS